jgi:outer membrane receptor protein involved in Fe transport
VLITLKLILELCVVKPKTDLQLTYAGAAGHWRIAAYVQNVEDHAVRSADFTLLGHVFSDFNPPRLFGVRVSYRY